MVIADFTETQDYAEEERQLQTEFNEAERVLAGIEAELRVVDDELDVLEEERPNYDLVAQICLLLETLDADGRSDLFWPEGMGGVQQLDHARQQIEQYREKIAVAEARREEIVGRIEDATESLDRLHYDLRAVMTQRENYTRQWIVERDDEPLRARDFVMPWSRGQDEDRLYHRSVGISVLAATLLALIVSAITLPIPERATVDKLPERVARLVRHEMPPPPPVEKPPPKEEEPEVTKPEPEPEVAKETPPEQAPESKPKPGVPKAEPDAKERVRSQGILAFRDTFAKSASLRTDTKLGSAANLSTAGARSVGRPERSMVATSARGSSGGINLSSISRDVGGGGGAIEGVEVGRVASSIGGTEGSDRPLSGGVQAGRTDEEIQIVFDRYKAALYRLYNRELRKDPTLRGQLILKLTIEPDGTVSMCQLQSSDMDAPELAQQVVARVGTFDFGAKDVAAMTIVYPIDFLPSV